MADPELRHRPRFSPLAREITAILAVKAIALYVIWLAFFSAPAGRTLDAAAVARSVVNAPAPSQPQETDHASGHGPR